MPLIAALGSQAEVCEFTASLGYRVKPYLGKEGRKKIRMERSRAVVR